MPVYNVCIHFVTAQRLQVVAESPEEVKSLFEKHGSPGGGYCMRLFYGDKQALTVEEIEVATQEKKDEIVLTKAGYKIEL